MPDKQSTSKELTDNRVNIPKPAETVRREHPMTGELSPLIVFGFALKPGQLEAWARAVNYMPNERSFTQRNASFMFIMSMLPGYRYSVVTPHYGDPDMLQKCIVVGGNRSEQDLVDVSDPERIELIQGILGPDAGEPKWYYVREDFEYDD